MISFFAWNFFDGCLGLKEWFSPYIFEKTAKELIEKHPEIKDALKKAIEDDPKLHKMIMPNWLLFMKKALNTMKCTEDTLFSD
jgi:hypothetical protein